ncbi:MAG TPA: sugar ABC transporter substrate-binding protein [Ktedonobacteraceae bacterium]|nr:sugar ABC transporter substrate-binding protein [Ktedonobacteraceae bacterium]
MKMRKFVRALSLLLPGIVMLFLSACGGPSSNGGAGNPVTISFWIRAADQTFAQPLVDAYNKSHTNQVKLTIIPNDNFVTKFASASAAGTPPDVVGIDLVFLPAFAAHGQMTDLTDKAKALPFFNQLNPSHVRLSTYQGSIYALPFSGDASFLVYNKDLFQKAGLDPNTPPKTWAEIEQDAAKIRALGPDTYGFYFSGSCGGCNIFTFMPYIWASGGDILNAEGTQATVSPNPVLKDALSFYHRMWQAGDVPPSAKSDPGTNFFTPFSTGKIGIQGTGSFAVGTLKQQFPNINFGVAPFPSEDGSSVSSFAGGDVIGVPKGSQHVNEAFDFINWCLTDTTQVEQFAKGGSIPVRTDLAKNKYSQLDERYVLVNHQMSIGKTVYSVYENQLINDNNGPWATMLQKAIFGGDIDGAMNTAQQQFTQILNSGTG